MLYFESKYFEYKGENMIKIIDKAIDKIILIIVFIIIVRFILMIFHYLFHVKLPFLLFENVLYSPELIMMILIILLIIKNFTINEKDD